MRRWWRWVPIPANVYESVSVKGKLMLVFLQFMTLAKDKAAQWASVSADIDVLRGAVNHGDFRSRCAAVEGTWKQAGLGAGTAPVASSWVAGSSVPFVCVEA